MKDTLAAAPFERNHLNEKSARTKFCTADTPTLQQHTSPTMSAASFTKVVVFSQSLIKRNAVKALFPGLGQFGLECIKPTDTECPQPIGLKAARECIDKRWCNHQKLVEAGSWNTLFLVIENWVFPTKCTLTPDGKETVTDAVDCCAVLAMTNGGLTRWYNCGASDESITVPLPSEYCARLSAHQTQHLRAGFSNGLLETFGESIRRASGDECPSDDWFKFVSPKNPSRHQQIVASLRVIIKSQMPQTDLLTRALDSPPAVYIGYPKPHVEFQDMFHLLANPQWSREFYARLSAVCSATDARLRAGRDGFFIAGLESRGLCIGMVAAALLNVPFIALRKKDKLPRDEARPIEAVSYKTEYSTDTIELQPTHLDAARMLNGSLRRCILVDDLIATGGSARAGIDLLQRHGVNVSDLVVIRDVPALRKQWVAALKHCRAPLRVSFML